MKFKMMFGNPSVMDQNIRIEIEKIFFKSKIRTSLKVKFEILCLQFKCFFIVVLSIFTLKFSITDTLEKFIYGRDFNYNFN